MLELRPELLELLLVLVAHIVRLLHAFLTNSPYLSAQDVAQLLNTNTSQRHGVPCLVVDRSNTAILRAALLEVTRLRCQLLRLQLVRRDSRRMVHLGLLQVAHSTDVLRGKLELVRLSPLRDRHNLRLLLLLIVEQAVQEDTFVIFALARVVDLVRQSRSHIRILLRASSICLHPVDIYLAIVTIGVRGS